MKLKAPIVFAGFAVLLLLGSCVPSGMEEEPSGFLWGVWHGFIIIFSAFAKLFGFDVGIYALNNTGWPYWLGFILGLFIALGSGGRASRKRS